MTRPAALVLRPSPGNAATAARLAAAGIDAVALPLFGYRALAWTVPDPARYDALLLTSAAAVRLGGEGLRALRHLPVLAVGQATAAAARTAGFRVALTGDADAAALVAAARAGGHARPLHLAGREHRATGADTIPVYAADPLPITPAELAAAFGRTAVTLLHSPRAARRLAALAGGGRRDIAIAALSPAVLTAAGTGWRRAETAAVPDDDALVALVRDRIGQGD